MRHIQLASQNHLQFWVRSCLTTLSVNQPAYQVSFGGGLPELALRQVMDMDSPSS